MWKRKLEVVKFLWKQKHFEEIKKLETETNSEAFDFLRSRKRKHFSEDTGRDVEAEANSEATNLIRN